MSGGSDKIAILWDVASGSKVRSFVGHSRYPIIFSHDGSHLLTGSSDTTLRLWDTATGSELRVFDDHSSVVSAVLFSIDAKRAISGSWDHTIGIWDITSGKLQQRLTGHDYWVTSLAISRDGRYLLSAGGKDLTLRLWDLSTGGNVKIFKGHTNYVSSAALSPNVALRSQEAGMILSNYGMSKAAKKYAPFHAEYRYTRRFLRNLASCGKYSIDVQTSPCYIGRLGGWPVGHKRYDLVASTVALQRHDLHQHFGKIGSSVVAAAHKGHAFGVATPDVDNTPA